YGARVVIVSGKNAADRKDCTEILKAAIDLAPIDAIFNLAVVLKDSLWENQTSSQFVESFKPKAWSTKNLDDLSRKLCPQLRHFVVFSSVSCGRGNAGQTNYGMSNSVMERICETRVADGFPALAIQWGAIGDVGLVADMQNNNEELIIGGTLQQKISSCLQELNGFLTQDSPIVSSMVVAEKNIIGSNSLNIVDTVLNIMNVKDLKAISNQTPLAELGMDSMMAVEIKQTLEREFDIFLTAQDVRGLSFAKLLEINSNNAIERNTNSRNTSGEETMKGLQLLIRLLETNTTNTGVQMKLQTKRETGKQKVFLIPGIEGYGSIFSDLAGKIESPATCLQLDNTQTDYLSIPDIANQLLPHVLLENQGRRYFMIVGYSFGSLVAIELARKLEAEGLMGKLILIDGAPELMTVIKNQQLAASNNEELETNLLVGIMDMVVPALSKELSANLQQCISWQEKLDKFMAYIPTKSSMSSAEHQRNIYTSIYKRLIALGKYDISNLSPLRTPILLLKPSTATVKNLPHDYGLNKVTREKVEVYTIEGNHSTILDNMKIAMAINGEPLEDAEEFKASIMEDKNITSL
ncbi:hypothetical protein PV326_009658, partial [Microctonus aethiopoides]